MATWRHMVRSSLVFTSLVSLSKAASTNKGMHWTVRTLHSQWSKIKFVLLYFNSLAHKHRWHKMESFLIASRSQTQRWNENVKIFNHRDFVTSCTANVTSGFIILLLKMENRGNVYSRKSRKIIFLISQIPTSIRAQWSPWSLYYTDLDSRNFIFILPYFKAMSLTDWTIFIKYSLEVT